MRTWGWSLGEQGRGAAITGPEVLVALFDNGMRVFFKAHSYLTSPVLGRELVAAS